MRLRQLKVCGFKSFADTTVIEFPGQVTGIVGPNGCGKSNVMDAVRWVLGEGRVGELRGQASMSELIFSGSAKRPASSRASVEMVLDNSDGTLSGPWSRYTEVSVRRVINRDGASAYLINNQHVRRRDVQEIFLGTGLGSRSYAIISQGMISSLIRARPEELRVFLEEAAGVSRYRERRRETWNSLAATRSNLERVACLQESKRIEAEKLEQQARSAVRWRELDRQRQSSEELLYFTLEEESVQEAGQADAVIAAREADFAALQGRVHRLSLEADARRDAATGARKAADSAREAKFRAERQVLEAENSVRRILDERNRLAAASAAAAASLERQRSLAAGTRQRMERLLQDAEKERSAALAHEREAASLEGDMGQAEKAWRESRQFLEEARRRSLSLQNRVGVAGAELEALNREADGLEDRLRDLKKEQAATSAPDENRCRDLAARIRENTSAVRETAAEIERLELQRNEAERLLSESVEQKASLSRRWAGTSARLQALESVQEEALRSGQLAGWLTRMGLSSAGLLLEKIQPAEGWTTALEAALSIRSAALEVGSLGTAAGFGSDPPPARLAIYGTCPQREREDASGGMFPPLRSLVGTGDRTAAAALDWWLWGFFAAPDLREALKEAGRLRPGERIVTRDGHVLDGVSVCYWAEEKASSGVISRGREILSLREESVRVRRGITAADEAIRSRRSELSLTVSRLKEKRSLIESVRSETHRFEVEHSRLETAVESWKKRSGRVAGEISSLSLKLEEKRLQCSDSDRRLGDLDSELSSAQQLEEKAAADTERLRLALDGLEKRHRSLVSEAMVERARAESLETRAADSRRSELEASEEACRLEKELLEINGRLAATDEKAARDGLSGMLAELEAATQALAAAESKAAEAENTAGECRVQLEKTGGLAAPLLQEISELKVKRQASLTRAASHTAWLDERNADRDALRQRFVEEKPRPAQLKQKVGRLASEIASLGPVNHAAVEQLESCRRAIAETERQVRDLEEAIANLENTVRRIDAETRALLKSTFDTVNRNFSEMFRGFFGGGSAELRMEGGEILESGVEVIARPPGKKNSSVRILSGGEQALAATALVFAIFRLNPAPFCLLDEVDAPLDEANQDRLGRQIIAMSSKTQFVMITHHRVTMELLGRLVGITMNEPGVSRVVSVDVTDAGKIAGS